MVANKYHLVSRWRVRGQVGEVFEILSGFAEMPCWWPEGFLSISRLAGEPGLAVGVVSRGLLPYTLSWTARLTSVEAPWTFGIEVDGDFQGQGRWTLEQNGEWVEVTFVWTIRVLKPLVRRLSWLLRPVFAFNHRWAMARGEEGLKRELQRRRAQRLTAAQVA